MSNEFDRLGSEIETFLREPKSRRKPFDTDPKKVLTPEKVLAAIPHPEVFLAELAKLDEGGFWELNTEGQLVMGDCCPKARIVEPRGKFNYDQSRTAATRVTYLDAEGNVQVLDGDGFRKNSNGNIVLPKRRGVIPASSILFARGLVSGDDSGSDFGNTSEHGRECDRRHDRERPEYSKGWDVHWSGDGPGRVWVESGKKPKLAFCRFSYDSYRNWDVTVRGTPQCRDFWCRTRSVLRVNLKAIPGYEMPWHLTASSSGRPSCSDDPE